MDEGVKGIKLKVEGWRGGGCTRITGPCRGDRIVWLHCW